MSSAAGQVAMLAHGKRVRILYKTILKLHRGLPAELAYMGDAYVKDEFKRHKKASPEQTVAFMEAWAVSDKITHSCGMYLDTYSMITKQKSRFSKLETGKNS